MFSVIIQNQKTIEKFNEYSIFFAAPEVCNNVALCKWIEEGQTIDKALPGLVDITDDKEEWRAVIVLTEYDDISGILCDPLNPFDFGNVDIQNPPALIRLTHMLGEIPRPELEFVSEIVKSPGQDDKVVFKPVKNEEQEKIYEELREKYSFNGKRPSEIVIVSTRQAEKDTAEVLKNAWKDKYELTSSDFCKTNRYPSICRFVIFDLKNNGKIQYESDMFNFWMSVMLLASNHIKASSLQAYRLYNMECIFDKTIMQKYFQKCIYRVDGAKLYINDTRKQMERDRLEKKREIPDYRKEVKVVINDPKRKDIKVEKEEFEVIPNSISGDLTHWYYKEKGIAGTINNTLQGVEHDLDETAENMRQSCKYPKDGIYRLADYQKYDMEHQLDVLHEEIIDIQSKLPMRNSTFSREAKDCSNEIERNIRRRIDKDQFKKITGTVIALIIGMSIPGFALSNNGAWMNTIVVMLGLLVLLGITTAAVMLYQKGLFNKLIEKYNKIINEYIGGIIGDADLYSEYMSAIASRCNGSSFLLQMKNVSLRGLDDDVQIAYLDKLDELKPNIERWCRCNYLNVDIDSEYYENVAVDDSSMSADVLAAKILMLERKYSTNLNDTGEVLYAPFGFIRELRLEREELYDGI